MKIFTTEHSFSKPWQTVSAAHWTKYANEQSCSHVTGLDYLHRSVDAATGVLHTIRLIRCKQPIPSFAARLLLGSEQAGSAQEPAAYGLEESWVDAAEQSMRIVTHNLSLSDVLLVREHCSYQQAGDKATPATSFSQQASITSRCGWRLLATKIEEFCFSRFQANASKGKAAMEKKLAELGDGCSPEILP